jgi:tetratricopeptide (TPR) repeat protein
VYYLRAAGTVRVGVQPAMDDSRAELPLSPAPLPADNASAVNAARMRCDSMASIATSESQHEAAQAALELGDLWRSESISRAQLSGNPRDRTARLCLAACLRSQTRFAEASAIYEQMLAQDGRDSDAYLGMADTSYAANDRPGAFRWIARGITNGAQTSIAITTFAHRYQDWKDFPKAEQAVNRFLATMPNDVNALSQLASIQVEGGELDAAYSTLTRLFQLAPDDELTHRLMAVVLMNATFRHQDLNRARGLLEKAVELDGHDKDIYRCAAIIYREQRLYRLAAQAYDALLRLDPTSLDGRYGLGQVYAQLGKPELSGSQLAVYRRLDKMQRRVTRLSEEVLHHPHSANAQANLAHCFQEDGDYARALPRFQIAARLEPKSSSRQADLQRLYNHLGWPPPKVLPQ